MIHAGDQDGEDEDAFLRAVTSGTHAAQPDSSLKVRLSGETAWSAAVTLRPGIQHAGMMFAGMSYAQLLCNWLLLFTASTGCLALHPSESRCVVVQVAVLSSSISEPPQ